MHEEVSVGRAGLISFGGGEFGIVALEALEEGAAILDGRERARLAGDGVVQVGCFVLPAFDDSLMTWVNHPGASLLSRRHDEPLVEVLPGAEGDGGGGASLWTVIW